MRHRFEFNDKELLALRDAVGTEWVEQNKHVKRQGIAASAAAKERAAILRDLLVDLKNRIDRVGI
jgi:hypothetical protein